MLTTGRTGVQTKLRLYYKHRKKKCLTTNTNCWTFVDKLFPSRYLLDKAEYFFFPSLPAFLTLLSLNFSCFMGSISPTPTFATFCRKSKYPLYVTFCSTLGLNWWRWNNQLELSAKVLVRLYLCDLHYFKKICFWTLVSLHCICLNDRTDIQTYRHSGSVRSVAADAATECCESVASESAP